MHLHHVLPHLAFDCMIPLEHLVANFTFLINFVGFPVQLLHVVVQSLGAVDSFSTVFARNAHLDISSFPDCFKLSLCFVHISHVNSLSENVLESDLAEWTGDIVWQVSLV